MKIKHHRMHDTESSHYFCSIFYKPDPVKKAVRVLKPIKCVVTRDDDILKIRKLDKNDIPIGSIMDYHYDVIDHMNLGIFDNLKEAVDHWNDSISGAHKNIMDYTEKQSNELLSRYI